MQSKVGLFLLVLVLLSACSPSPSAIQTAIAQTQAAAPTPTPFPSPAPKTIPTILASYGFNERPELEAKCNCIVYKSAPTTSGMTTIQVYNSGNFVISAPVDPTIILPMLTEIYGSEVASWIKDNSKQNGRSQYVGNDAYNTGDVGKYHIEIDFSSDWEITLIEIKSI